MKNSYPQRLLPGKKYCTILIFPESINSLFVTRTTEKNVRLCTKAEIRERLSEHVQASRFLNGLSVNLVSVYRGGDSRIALNFKRNRELSRCWQDGDDFFRPHRRLIKHRHSGYFGFLIGDIQSIKLDNVELKNGRISNGRYNLSFKLYHKPTCCNFWHCEFHIYCKSLDDEGMSGTIQELCSKDIVSKSLVTKIANQMMDSFKDLVKSKHEIKRRNLNKNIYQL